MKSKMQLLQEQTFHFRNIKLLPEVKLHTVMQPPNTQKTGPGSLGALTHAVREHHNHAIGDMQTGLTGIKNCLAT